MVTQIFDTSDRRALLSSVRSTLKAKGWSVDHVQNHRRLDFNIKKNDANLSLKFLDGSDLRYKSIDRLLEDMTVDGQSLLGLESRHIVWVYTNHFLDSFREDIAKRDLIVIDVDAILILDEICDAEKVNVEDLDLIRLMLLKRSAKSCVKVAAQYEQAGDLAAAIEWLRAGTRATLNFSASHRQLFYTLIKVGKREEAYEMGKEMLTMRPDARSLAAAMVNLATVLERKQDIARWKALQERSDLERVQPKEFENLISKIAGSYPPLNVKKDHPRAERSGSAFLQKLGRKFFGKS